MLGFFAFFLILLAASGAGLAYMRYASALVGFSMILLAAGLAVLNMFLALLVGAIKRKGTSKFSVFVGVCASGAIGFLVYLAMQHPTNDLTTDTKNPVKFLHPTPRYEVAEGKEYAGTPAMLSREYDPEAANAQLEKYPEIPPIKTTFVPDAEFFLLISKMIQESYPSWKIVLADKEKLHLEAEAESEFFHFVDDVAIELRPEGTSAGRIDFRSRSRYGKSDLGMNYRRLNDLMERVRKESYAYEAVVRQKESAASKAAMDKMDAADAAEKAAKEAAAAKPAAPGAASATPANATPPGAKPVAAPATPSPAPAPQGKKP